jgi:hypothetical protein
LIEVFLAILVAAWAAVFLPAAVRAHRGEPLVQSQRFKRGMDAIAPPRRKTGRWVVSVGGSGASDRLKRTAHQRAQERRTRFLKYMLRATSISGVTALFFGGYLWHLTITMAVSLLVYVFMLLHTKHRRNETIEKVRSIEGRRRRVAPDRRDWEALERRA